MKRSRLQQMDMFSTSAAPPVRPARVASDPSALTREYTDAVAARALAEPPFAPLPLPTRVPAWEALLGRSAAASDVIIVCLSQCSGVCLEVLSCPEAGRQWLNKDGTIDRSTPDTAFGRFVYATPDMCRGWHAKRALIPFGDAGKECVRFRFGDAPGAAPLGFPKPFREAENAGS